MAEATRVREQDAVRREVGVDAFGIVSEAGLNPKPALELFSGLVWAALQQLFADEPREDDGRPRH
jgi:hypothetical protein